MNTQNKSNVSDALSQKAVFVKIGGIPFPIRPLTFMQMQEIGDIMRNANAKEAQEEESLIVYAFSRPELMLCIQEIAIKVLFKGSIKRKLLGWYIRRNFNSEAWKGIFEAITSNFDYRFFFQSFISLKGMLTEKKTNTKEAQAPGQC